MNYYEELGLPADAADEDIRRAHRTLSKVLHPDRQTDPSARDAAELQMRRLNVIVDTLLDPRTRRDYDAGLHVERPAPVFPRPHERVPPRKRRILGPVTSLLLIVTAGLIVTAAAAWFVGGDLLHFQTSENRPANSPPSAAPTIPLKPVTPARTLPRQVVKIAPRDVPSDRHRAAQPTVDPVPREDIPEEPGPQRIHLPSAPLPAEVPSETPSIPVVPRPNESSKAVSRTPTLAGLWLYAPDTVKNGPVKLYAPEYIELRIRDDNESVHGEYSARYQVSDRPISSAVAFHFEGKPDTGSFAWQADDGSRGVVDLKLINAESLQVNWRVNHFGTRMGLGAGTAMLIRKMNP